MLLLDSKLALVDFEPEMYKVEEVSLESPAQIHRSVLDQLLAQYIGGYKDFEPDTTVDIVLDKMNVVQ